MSTSDEMRSRVEDYARENKLVLGPQLGYGVHGTVFVGECQEGGKVMELALNISFGT